MNKRQEPRALVIKAAIVAEVASKVVVGDMDEIPGTDGGPAASAPPAWYVGIDLSRRWHPERLGDADVVPGWALTTHYRAPNITDLRTLRDGVTAALEDRALDLPDGDTLGPFSFQFDGGPRYIDGGWSDFDTWNA